MQSLLSRKSLYAQPHSVPKDLPVLSNLPLANLEAKALKLITDVFI